MNRGEVSLKCKDMKKYYFEVEIFTEGRAWSTSIGINGENDATAYQSLRSLLVKVLIPVSAFIIHPTR